jgi:hypothetical protein
VLFVFLANNKLAHMFGFFPGLPVAPNGNAMELWPLCCHVAPERGGWLLQGMATIAANKGLASTQSESRPASTQSESRPAR